MTTHRLFQATARTVHAELARLGPVAPHRDGYLLEVPFSPEPAQIAHAECALARRGYTPDLRDATAVVRLVASVTDGCWRLGFERVLRIGPVLLPLTEGQARLLDRILAEIGQRIDARYPVPA